MESNLCMTVGCFWFVAAPAAAQDAKAALLAQTAMGNQAACNTPALGTDAFGGHASHGKARMVRDRR